MSIRFKFRSSVNFETLEIGNRASIFVKELRAHILHGKNSQLGFDLIFSDAVSGLEFKRDDSPIPSGSSVIVKRVPGGTVPSALPPVPAVKELKESHTPMIMQNEPMDEFDDFGVDLCPMPDSNFPDFVPQSDKKSIMGNKKEETAGFRLEGQKLDISDQSQVIPRGSNQSGNERNVLPAVDERMKLDKLPTSNFLAVQSTNLPLELKCSLCSTFFKEAVMIPCCQHSFCQKCIHQVLTEKRRCPKCFSSKCNVEDLLPNLSLRRAIEHFLESQMLDAGLENAMDKYVPDGESAIQARDVSCAFSVAQREPELHQSSCATGRGSNQVFVEAYNEQYNQRHIPHMNSVTRDTNSAFPSHIVNHIDGVRGGYPHNANILRGSEDFEPPADFQGENQPVIPQANVLNEADSNIRRKGGYWGETGGGERNFFGIGGHRKGARNCYTCGSPEHLMRDCPVSNPNPMFQPGNGAFPGGMPGYTPPYWTGSQLPPFRPYANLYNNPAMMPFNASMVPVAPFNVPPYTPSMGGFPGPGHMRMGTMGPPRHPEYFGLQPCENRRKHSDENLGREQRSDNESDSLEAFRRDSPEKLHDYILHKDREPSLSHSGDSFNRRSVRKTQQNKFIDSDTRHVEDRHEKNSRSFAERGKRPYNAERSNSGRSSDRQSDGRHKHHHHHGESKKYHERRGRGDGELSFGHHSAQKDVKRRVDADLRKTQKNHYSESGHKERDSGHSAKRSRDKHHEESIQHHRDEYRHHKRKAY